MSRNRGVLTDSGDWQCECIPPLLAIYLQVKKESPNKGRFFYKCPKPDDERCSFFLWDTDAERREKEKFGETLKARAERRGNGTSTPPKPVERQIEQPTTDPPPSKQPAPVEKIYPLLPSTEDDEFEYFDTPTRPRLSVARKQKLAEQDSYHWEEPDDEDVPYKKNVIMQLATNKRPRFDDPMEDIEYSPPMSPPFKKPNLGDPFATPPKQITSTPHTPPDTKGAPSAGTNLLPLSYSLLHQLRPHAPTLGTSLWQSVRDHLLRCGRVADGAVKGRDSARTVMKKREKQVEGLEHRVKVLEAEREVDRAVIGALKKNVDVLLGKDKRLN